MNPSIRDDIRCHLKERIKDKYSLMDEDMLELGGYQNFVYGIKKENRDCILRITESYHRSKQELMEEIHFVNLLHANHVSVSKAILINQDWVEEISTNENKYFITFFEKAIGKNWYEFETNNHTYFQAGKELGKIHHISKTLSKNIQRKTIFENGYLQIAKSVIDDQEILDKFDEMRMNLKRLPQKQTSYGLTHGDYNFANMIYKNSNEITIFDFDECEYNWYIYDIAVFLFYYLLGGNPAQMDIEPNIELFCHFMQGYLSETEIDVFWIEQMPLFLRLRELILLASIYRSNDIKKLSKWNQAFVDAATDRIKNNKNFIEIDFVSVYNNLI